jgi:hypothetical protein
LDSLAYACPVCGSERRNGVVVRWEKPGSYVKSEQEVAKEIYRHEGTGSRGAPARNHAAFIWSVADLLRGDYKQSEYGKVILPLTVLRRLDGVLSPTKRRVLEKHKQLQGRLSNVGPVLTGITGVQFWNTSELELRKVLDDPPNVADQLRQYVAGFSGDVRDIFEKFDLEVQIARLDASNLLYLVLGKFVDIDLGPESVSNTEMGYLYEELIRRFSELSNETAGEHFTPREVVELMGTCSLWRMTTFSANPARSRPCSTRRTEEAGLEWRCLSRSAWPESRVALAFAS